MSDRSSTNSLNKQSSLDQMELQETMATIEAESRRRIEGLRQSIEFACTSLRAHGNMQINQLLSSVRQLTMDEFCNKYGADTLVFLEEQTRKRRGEGISSIPQKRSLGPSEKKNDISKLSSKVDSLRAVKERDSPLITQSGQTTSVSQKESTRPVDTMVQEPKPKTRSQRQVPREVESNQDNTGDVNHMSGTRSSPGHSENNEQPEINCGPLFVHLKREKHPKITLRLNSQQEASEFGPFEVSAPTELFEKLSDQQRRRIIDQIQDIQDQLELLKDQL
ncbi:hypothetical protein CLU79DRAFT_834694 [Phycomyces nitens]|nr:hypothetical protein CLU79DRAFT_834694 [Phycomyces nitens]